MKTIDPFETPDLFIREYDRILAAVTKVIYQSPGAVSPGTAKSMAEVMLSKFYIKERRAS